MKISFMVLEKAEYGFGLRGITSPKPMVLSDMTLKYSAVKRGHPSVCISTRLGKTTKTIHSAMTGTRKYEIRRGILYRWQEELNIANHKSRKVLPTVSIM